MILLKVYPMILSSPLLESVLWYLYDSFFFHLCPCFSLVHEALCFFFFNFYLFLIGG